MPTLSSSSRTGYLFSSFISQFFFTRAKLRRNPETAKEKGKFSLLGGKTCPWLAGVAVLT